MHQQLPDYPSRLVKFYEMSKINGFITFYYMLVSKMKSDVFNKLFPNQNTILYWPDMTITNSRKQMCLIPPTCTLILSLQNHEYRIYPKYSRRQSCANCIYTDPISSNKMTTIFTQTIQTDLKKLWSQIKCCIK